MAAALACFRGNQVETLPLGGGLVVFKRHEDYADAALGLASWCRALIKSPTVERPPSPPKPAWTPAGDRPLGRRKRRARAPPSRSAAPAPSRSAAPAPSRSAPARSAASATPPPPPAPPAFLDDALRCELTRFEDDGYGLVVARCSLRAPRAPLCEFRLRGPRAASTNVAPRLAPRRPPSPRAGGAPAPPTGERLATLAFRDEPPSTATLLLLADDPVSD